MASGNTLLLYDACNPGLLQSEDIMNALDGAIFFCEKQF